MAESRISAEIFRAYDIRGIVGQGLDADSVRLIGQAIASEARDLGEHSILVGRDARLSSPALSLALVEGLCNGGCNVIDLGVVPTPLLYFATQTLSSGSGVMITGSHNPRDYNGIKIVLQKRTLADNQIARLRERIEDNDLRTGNGSVSRHDIKPEYLGHIQRTLKLQKKFKVVIDAGNGVGGLIAPILFARLGCEVVPLYCEPDGNFPNHHPDPTREKNLKALKTTVLAEQADLGIGLDGDADRVGIVTASGKTLNADHLLMAFAMDILPDNPGACVVFDVKSSHHLGQIVTANGGVPVMCKSGHSFVKQKLVETDALLGGEFSAHIFFKHRWFGFDDGMYAAARFLELMDKYDAAADAILDRLPPSCSTPELFIPVAEAHKFELMAELTQQLSFPDAAVSLLDGVRADFDHGWGLIRASNTTPNLVLRFEADNAAELAGVQQQFRTALLAIKPELQLPF
ncbi:MAG TPA: phosphomannomutase/phosphoglucomutase [Candidatus Acidoferrum sp.]|nr:phosphomannomutase/phosphoglucomutase [Candidatus Acidoferrum sp.]